MAIFRENLVKPLILAGCPKDAIVIDPFGGSGTTALVALKLGRRAISADLGYHNIARKRLTNIQPVMPGLT